MDFKLINDTRVVLAETPIWDSRIKKLYWTDLFKGTVHRFDPVTGLDESVETGSVIGSAIPCDAIDKVLVAVDDGMMLLDFKTAKMELIAAPQANNGEFRYNDTRCDPVGRIFTSTVSKHFTEPDFDPNTMTGKFYMIEPNGEVKTLVDKLVQYNTFFLDNKNQNLYAVDTYTKKLLRFNYTLESGASGEPETVIQFEEMPDGVAIDTQDNIYVCHWSDKRHITVWNLKDYKLIKSIPFPVKNICCPGFAGDDLKDFYVTTSNFWLPDGDPDFKAGAGGIFKSQNEIPGKPENFYKIKK
jgi:sugar lactone lactonase YvrE